MPLVFSPLFSRFFFQFHNVARPKGDLELFKRYVRLFLVAPPLLFVVRTMLLLYLKSSLSACTSFLQFCFYFLLPGAL